MVGKKTILIFGIFSTILIFSIVMFVMAAPGDNQTIVRTPTTETICYDAEPVTKEVCKENQCLDWDERNWTDINCGQYNRYSNPSCSQYSDPQVDCSQYDVPENRTNCSALGDTPRSIMTCIKSDSCSWDGETCEDTCTSNSACELSGYAEEESCVQKDYQTNCDDAGCSWDSGVCEYIYDFTQDQTDCLANSCSWEGNTCLDDIENATYCAGGFDTVCRDEVETQRICTSTLYSGLMNYNNSGIFEPINSTIVDINVSFGINDYIYGVDKGAYKAYFKETSDWTVGGAKIAAMVKDDYIFTFTPAVSTDRYINFDNDCVGSNFGKRIATKSTSVDAVVNGDMVTYPNQYTQYQQSPSFANLTYRYLNDRLKEELVIWDKDWLQTRYDNCYDSFDESVDMEFTMDTHAFYQEDIGSNSMGISIGRLSQTLFKEFGSFENNEITTSDEVHFMDSENNSVFYIPKLYAYDSNGSEILLNKTLIMVAGGGLRTIVLTPFSWMNSSDRVYPIYIDPTVQLQDADTENLGDTDTYSISDSGDSVFWVGLPGGEVATAYIKFNFTSFLGYFNVTNSTLALYTSGTGALEGDEQIDLNYVDNQSWSEDSCDDTSNCPSLTSFLSTETIDSSSGFTFYNVQALTTNCFNSGEENCTIGIEGNDFAAGEYIQYRSKEHATSETRPYLNVTYVSDDNISISDCITLDRENATYYLTSDITDSPTSDCIDITANNVVLNCQGNTIDGNGLADDGISIQRDSPGENVNITVKNCILTDWDTTAMNIDYADNVTIDNVTISGNSATYSISSVSSDNFIVNNSNIGGNPVVNAIDLSGNVGYTFENTVISGGAVGIDERNGCSGTKTITNSNITGDEWAIDPKSTSTCGFVLTNVLGANDLPIYASDSQVTLNNWNNNVSQIILCGSNSVINNLTLDGNYGIFVSGNDVNITNSNFSNHVDSIRTYYATDIRFENNLFNSASSNAIYLDTGTDDAIIVNNTFDGIGSHNIIFRPSSDGSLIVNNTFQNTDGSGGTFLDLVSTDNHNIYNNIFNSTTHTNSIIDVDAGTGNNFNTTKQSGTRIIGVGYIGGNYYTNTSGIGYSDTCTDADYDGICDTQYTGQGIAIDYLPLSDEGASFTVEQPTSGQTFTQDEPTAIFNITAFESMDECRVSFDAGVTNYTMDLIDSTTFGLINTSMIDGANTANFYCNATDDGEWFEYPVGVTFDVDSVNITVCRDLTVDSRNYTILNNLSIASGDCLVLSNTDNIILDGQGFKVETLGTSGGDNAIGLYVGSEGNTIKNIKPKSGDDCIAMSINSNNNIFVDISDISCGTIPSGDDSFDIVGDDNYIWNSTLVDDISLNSVENIIIYNTAFEDLDFINTNTNIIVVNGTYIAETSMASGDNMTRKWYADFQVNDSSGYLENAQVNIYDKDNNLEVSLLTDATGQIARQELIDYVNTGGSIAYNTPHTINISKATYTTNSTVYNLTDVNNVNHIVTLSLSNSAPTMTLSTPVNNYWSNSLTNTMICNSSDTDGNLKNVTIYTWISGASETINTKTITGSTNSSEWTNLGFTSQGNYEWNCYVCDDSDECAFAGSNFTLNIDALDPVIDFDSATETNNTNHSRNWIYANYTLTETNFENITFNLYNSTNGLENSTNYSTEIREINWTSLTDGVYYYNITVFDKASRSASTNTRKITIDDTNPTLTITYPSSGNSYNNGTDFQINYTVSDNLVGLDSCWYTNDSGVTNYPLTCGNNITHNFTDDTYTYVIYSNDTVNNTGSDSVTFTISSVSPAIVKDYPTSNLWINSGTDVYFNYTATDTDDLSECQLWGNWSSWHNNFTWSSGLISGTQNYTQVTIPEGTWKYNIWCNDTLDNGDFSPSNVTFNIDETFPAVTNQSYLPTTVYNNLDVVIYGNMTDTNLDTVWIEINFTGSYQNITVSDKIGNQYNYTLGNANIDNFENVSWRWWANDSANNQNSSDLEYFITTNRNPYDVNITNPANDSYINTDYLIINFTATDDDADTLNYSVYYANSSLSFSFFNSTVSNSLNLTGFNTTDGATNYFYVAVNDSVLQNETVNYTFHVDKTDPTLTLDEPEASPAVQCSMVNIDLKYNANDTNIDYCEFNVTLAGSTSTAHTTIPGCTNTTFNVAFDNSVQLLTLRAVDKAGNYEETTRLIYIDTDNAGCASPETPGGGSSPVVEPEDLGFCGDNICNEDRGESFYNCAEDCSRLVDIISFNNFNLDKIFFNCIDNDESTECFWTTNPAWFFLFISFGIWFLFSILFEFKPGKGGVKRVVYTGLKKKRKRRR